MSQLALFADERRTDPPHNNRETSILAAEAIRPHVGRQQQAILDYLRGCDGDTRDGIEAATGIHGNAVRPRCLELLKLRLIVETNETRLTRSGRKAYVLRYVRGNQ